jgi:hypothetical protein
MSKGFKKPRASPTPPFQAATSEFHREGDWSQALANIRGLVYAALVFMGLSAAGLVSAQSLVPEPVPKPDPEDLKRGAVLCAWQIYAVIREFGTTCHPSEDADVMAEIARSVDRIEQFIIINGHPDANYISTWEQRFHDNGKNKGFCKSKDAEQMYQAFAKSTPAEIKDKTDFLLAVPRMPVMNPCL